MLAFTVRFDNASNVPELIGTGSIPVHDNVAPETEILEYIIGPDHQLLPALGTARANYGCSPGNAAVDLKNGFPATKWSLFFPPQVTAASCPDAVFTTEWVPEPLSWERCSWA